MSQILDEPVVSETPRVRIRSLMSTDFEGLQRIWADPAVMRHMAIPTMTEEEASEAFSKLRSPDDYVRRAHRFAIVRQADDAVVGTFGLDLERFSSAYAHSMVTASETWGTGLAREAYHLLLRLAFEDIGVRRVWTACATTNERARNLILRMGYSQYGTIREYVRREERPIDCHTFSYLKPEWCAHQLAMGNPITEVIKSQTT